MFASCLKEHDLQKISQEVTVAMRIEKLTLNTATAGIPDFCIHLGDREPQRNSTAASLIEASAYRARRVDKKILYDIASTNKNTPFFDFMVNVQTMTIGTFHAFQMLKEKREFTIRESEVYEFNHAFFRYAVRVLEEQGVEWPMAHGYRGMEVKFFFATNEPILLTTPGEYFAPILIGPRGLRIGTVRENLPRAMDCESLVIKVVSSRTRHIPHPTL
jgi:hypothetical protein